LALPALWLITEAYYARSKVIKESHLQ